MLESINSYVASREKIAQPSDKLRLLCAVDLLDFTVPLSFFPVAFPF